MVTTVPLQRRPAARPAPVVGVLVEARYLDQAQPAGAAAALRSRGCEVRTLVAEQLVTDLGDPTWTEGLDVLLPRGRSVALLGLLGVAEAVGVPVVHPAAAVSRLVDKASMATTLRRHGVPTPRTWLGTPSGLSRRRDLVFPLVLKPVTGDNAQGLVVVADRRELLATRWPEPVALAQAFHRGDAHDVKLYVAGSEAWAVRRPSPVDRCGRPRVVADQGRPVPLTGGLAHLARRCAVAFGVPLLGIDVVGGPDESLVVEVNEFPTYRGVLERADRRIADVVLAVADRGRASRGHRTLTGARS